MFEQTFNDNIFIRIGLHPILINLITTSLIGLHPILIYSALSGLQFYSPEGAIYINDGYSPSDK